MSKLNAYDSFIPGPMVGGELVRAIGFPWLMTSVGVINLLYCLPLARLDITEAAEPILDVSTL